MCVGAHWASLDQKKPINADQGIGIAFDLWPLPQSIASSD